MEEQLVSLDTAKLAKEKGFDIYTMFYVVSGWSGEPKTRINFPTQSLLQKWLREQPTPIIVSPETDFVAWYVHIDHPDKGRILIDKLPDGKLIDSYEDALELGLQEALKFI